MKKTFNLHVLFCEYMVFKFLPPAFDYLLFTEYRPIL
jgi:hypothetical protein